MHGQDRYPDIYHIHIQPRHIQGHRSAAAEIHTAQLSHLPLHTVLIEDVPHMGGEFRRSLGRTGLPAGTGVFHHAHAPVDTAGIINFIGRGIVRIERRRHIRRKALGMGEHMPPMKTLGLGQVLNEICEELGIKARIPHTADLLFIRQNRNRRTLRRLHMQQGLQRRIRANAVIMPIGSDHTAIQADIHRTESRYKLQFGTGQILFANPILVVKQLHDLSLIPVFSLFILRGGACEQDIQILRLDGLSQRLSGLLLGEMGQQIRHAELGITIFFPHADFHAASVLAHHRAVHSQGDRRPLVFFNPAVVMRFQKGHLIFLVQRNGFQIQTR